MYAPYSKGMCCIRTLGTEKKKMLDKWISGYGRSEVCKFSIYICDASFSPIRSYADAYTQHESFLYAENIYEKSRPHLPRTHSSQANVANLFSSLYPYTRKSGAAHAQMFSLPCARVRRVVFGACAAKCLYILVYNTKHKNLCCTMNVFKFH